MANLQKIWQQAYDIVPAQLERVKEVKCAATAFNTNIDAVVKISGKGLSELAKSVGLSFENLQNKKTQLQTPRDVVRGIIKCFTLGIAEEWLCEDKRVYEWMRDNLRYDRLQMGGQAGIVANVLAVLGVQKVCAHTNSHPRLQAEQFLNMPNLLAVDEQGIPCCACALNRQNDEPLVHWIIEFDAGDVFELGGGEYVCPKANRFIATYDTANIELKINDGFLQYLNRNGFDYLILSGYHNLTEARGGLKRIAATIPLINEWKRRNPRGIIHLELASTQDKAVRLSILRDLAPLVHSVGMNDREALDALEVLNPQMFAAFIKKDLHAADLWQILLELKAKIHTPRMQLHFYGMYLTLQDKNFAITPEAEKRGMMLAATVAASKAGLGNIEKRENLLWAQGRKIGQRGIDSLQKLADFLHNPEFVVSGLTTYENMDLIAVPTILVDKPKTLVGMGDTISSVSLVGAR